MTKLEKLCIRWLNENFNPMEPFYMEKYPDYIFHMKNGQCILQYNKKCGYVYVSYREIWSFFEGVFSMSNQQIKDITKIWVEEYYKKSVTINELDSIIANRIEEQYREITTTKGEVFWLDKKVGEDYKKGVTTIYESNPVINDVVDENYKMVVTETKGVDTYGMMKVKEQYNTQTNG